MVRVMPNIQIITVLQTSARVLETGEIFLETVTAIGTEMAIDKIKPTFKSIRNKLPVTSLQYPFIFSKKSYPSTFTQFSLSQGHWIY